MTTDLDDTLTAAVARLRVDANKYPWLLQSHDIIAILAALEAAQVDARRYQWLRDGDGPQSSRWSRWRIEHWASPGPTWADIRGADLDAAIDAAMGEGT